MNDSPDTLQKIVPQSPQTVSGIVTQKAEIDHRSYNVKPTERAKLAYQIFVENRGLIGMGEAMRRAGYSVVYSTNPKQLTETDGFQQIIEKYLPDEVLAEKHLSLLNAKRKKTTFVKGQVTEVIEEEDTFAITNALKLGYQVKGKLVDKKQINGQLSVTALVAAVTSSDE